MIYVTSDHHWWHKNILKYCSRPFKDVEEMNEALIANHNSVVTEDDDVIMLGDFCFGGSGKGREILKRLNGNIIRIWGNHDKDGLGKSAFLNATLKYQRHSVYLNHFPENTVPGINLVGHVHDNWKCRAMDDRVIMNVGVDVWDYMPVGFEFVVGEALAAWKAHKSRGR